MSVDVTIPLKVTWRLWRVVRSTTPSRSQEARAPRAEFRRAPGPPRLGEPMLFSSALVSLPSSSQERWHWSIVEVEVNPNFQLLGKRGLSRDPIDAEKYNSKVLSALVMETEVLVEDVAMVRSALGLLVVIMSSRCGRSSYTDNSPSRPSLYCLRGHIARGHSTQLRPHCKCLCVQLLSD